MLVFSYQGLVSSGKNEHHSVLSLHRSDWLQGWLRATMSLLSLCTKVFSSQSSFLFGMHWYWESLDSN